MTHVLSKNVMNNIVLDIFENIIYRNESKVISYVKYYANYRNENGASIFDIENNKRNNIFMECCSNRLSDAAAFILDNYSELFDLGSMNLQGQTALMICIDNGMYKIAIELLDFPDAQPELTNENIKNTSLDLILRKGITDDNDKQILINLIANYLVDSPNNINFHKNLNIICSNQHIVELLQPHFDKTTIDFEKICLPVVPAEVSNFSNVNNVYDTRNVTSSKLKAKPYTIPIAEPANDMNFDVNEYSDDQMEDLRLQKRPRNRGGRKTNRKKDSSRPYSRLKMRHTKKHNAHVSKKNRKVRKRSHQKK